MNEIQTVDYDAMKLLITLCIMVISMFDVLIDLYFVGDAVAVLSQYLLLFINVKIRTN